MFRMADAGSSIILPAVKATGLLLKEARVTRESPISNYVVRLPILVSWLTENAY